MWYRDVMATASSTAPRQMDAEDPLFILLHLGSTGKSKGVLHTTGGYLLAAMTFKYIFDPGAPPTWAGSPATPTSSTAPHNGAIPDVQAFQTYPDLGRCWEVVDKHRSTSFTPRRPRSAR